ncbi:MAG: hypothetical protein JST81_07480 [Bacteroidetes bacterium]|nr:hypothetical protein [Bacteroidota bacterium]
METIYEAYTKVAQGRTWYCVKKYVRFPEYENVDDIREGFGMHTDFRKACSIAGIYNNEIRARLWKDVQATAPTGKIIEMKPGQHVFSKRIGMWLDNKRLFAKQSFAGLFKTGGI